MTATSQHASIGLKAFSRKILLKCKDNHQLLSKSTEQDSITITADTRNCTDQTVNQRLWLQKKGKKSHLLPSVDTGTAFPSLFSGLTRIISLCDFVVLPKRELSPSSLLLPLSLCSPVQWFFSVNNRALPSASTKINLSQNLSASLTSNKHQYGIIMETFKSWN